MRTLSVRQPWASFFFVNHPLAKDVENRQWWTRERGWIQIHAAKNMTKREYEEARDFAWSVGMTAVPRMEDLHLGGIIGSVRLVDCVKRSRSKWFTGPFGFVFTDAYPIPFVPCKGQLGFFEPVIF